MHLNRNRRYRSNRTSSRPLSPVRQVRRLRRLVTARISSYLSNNHSSNNKGKRRLNTPCLLLFRSLCRHNRRHKRSPRNRSQAIRLFLRSDTRVDCRLTNSNSCRRRVSRRISSMLNTVFLRTLILLRVSSSPHSRLRNSSTRWLRLNKLSRHSKRNMRNNSSSRERHRTSVNRRLRTFIPQRLPLGKGPRARLAGMGN